MPTVDLHLHTTASDGRLSPAELVERTAAAGLLTISVTDHDTVAAFAEVTTLAERHGMRVVPGTEVTAVDEGRDVHVLAYFIDPTDADFLAFLGEQRVRRAARARQIAARLAELGVSLDIEGLIGETGPARTTSIGRPQIARELIRHGHALSVQDAFDRYLGTGRPAYVARAGSSPADVIARIHAASGLASLAHPGVTRRDDLIPALAAAGLDALEVSHSDHPPDVEARYRAWARDLGLAETGGSDFHGDAGPSGSGRERRATLGVSGMPDEAFAVLERRHKEARRS